MEMFSFITCLIILSFLTLTITKYLFACLCIYTIDFFRKRKWLKKSNTGTASQSNTPKHKMLVNFYTGTYRYLMRKTGLIPVNWIRIFIYKTLFRMKIGKKVVIHYDLEIRDGFKISIGDGTIIGDHNLLDGRGGLTIGKNVNFSSYAQVYTAEHDANSRFFNGKSKSVTIGDRAWISDNCVVLPGADIGTGTVLAAGCIATKPCDSYSIYVGIPAVKKKERTKDLVYNFNGSSCWFY